MRRDLRMIGQTIFGRNPMHYDHGGARMTIIPCLAWIQTLWAWGCTPGQTLGNGTLRGPRSRTWAVRAHPLYRRSRAAGCTAGSTRRFAQRQRTPRPRAAAGQLLRSLPSGADGASARIDVLRGLPSVVPPKRDSQDIIGQSEKSYS